MINREDCCGCTACFHICPVKCINMEEDVEGFLYPIIDEKKCIHCHKCEKVCPVQQIDNGNTKTDTYVGYSRNEEIRKQSSSGGIFSVVAEWIIKQKGVVFGAAFDEKYNVCHVAIETTEELAKLRGSKYVQSRLENVYPQVKQYLEKKRKVLFTGTACQIAGLKKYLDTEYDNLYTIDVLCHGVPSPKIWGMYLEEKKKQYNAEIEKIQFRNKDNGWKYYCMDIEFSQMQRYCKQYNQDKYMRMFLDNLDLRPSCYKCNCKSFPRMSDMTIGDSWGIEKCMPDMDDDKGTSVILVHSPKGERMFERIRDNLIVREARLDEVLPSTADSRKSVEIHPNRKKYLESVKRGDNLDVLYKYVHKNIIQKGVGYIKDFVKKIIYKVK